MRRERRRAGAATDGETLHPAFRERLMLAVTEVNGCRYCRYAHARLALRAGLSRAEVDALAAGDLHGAPPEEAPALLYAQHWAEAEGRPDPETRGAIVETLGEARTGTIESVLRAIRIGNLAGNTWNYLLYRVSFGRWGSVKSKSPAPDQP